MKRYKMNKILQFLFVFLFMFGIFLIYLGCNNIKTILFNYKEDSDIHYSVYLKPNQFFEEPFLEENKTYIASLIDYINVDFKYTANYNQMLNGTIKYKYVAIVSANKKESDGYYWQKEYDLSEDKYITLNNSSQVSISDSFKISYDNYNNIANKFRKEYSLTTDAELKVLMKIDNDSKINGVVDPVKISSSASLSIPLLERSLEISMNKDVANNNKSIAFKQTDDDAKYNMYKLAGVILVIASIVMFINVTIARYNFKSTNEYELSLKKILDNYDSIIANTSNIPSLDEFKKINLSTFEELLDVYNEVRMPINYYQNERESRSTFLIINNNVWVYVLKKK